MKTVLGFVETFANAVAMKISAAQKHVLVEGPRKSPQDSDVNEGGVDRDAQAGEAHPLTASSRPRLFPREHLRARMRSASSRPSENWLRISDCDTEGLCNSAEILLKISQVAFMQMGLA